MLTSDVVHRTSWRVPSTAPSSDARICSRRVSSSGLVDIIRVLRQRGGVERFKELTEAGVSRQQIESARSRGDVERLHRGVYALPGTPRDVALARLFRAELTCVSWCARAGLPVPVADGRAHVAVPMSRAVGLPRLRPVDDVVLHRTTPRGVTGGGTAHLDMLAACVSPLEQVAVLDAALASGFISRHEVGDLEHGPRRRLDWLRTHVSPLAQSIGESFVRVALREAGLHVRPQARPIAVGPSDMVVEGALIVEVDGAAYHQGAPAFKNDRDRDRRGAIEGWTTMRFTHTEATSELGEVVADVVAWLVRHHDTPALRTRIDRAARVSDPEWWAGSAWHRESGS